MYSKDYVYEKLIALGADKNKLDQLIGEVVQVIILKALALYSSQLSAEDKSKLQNLSPDEIANFIKDNVNTGPSLSSQEFERIYDQTWDDYFKTMGK